MMNCQSDDCVRRSERVAWARTGRAAGRPSASPATSQNACSSGQIRSQVQAVSEPSHIEKSPFAPQVPWGRRIADRGG